MPMLPTERMLVTYLLSCGWDIDEGLGTVAWTKAGHVEHAGFDTTGRGTFQAKRHSVHEALRAQLAEERLRAGGWTFDGRCWTHPDHRSFADMRSASMHEAFARK